ncbi:MULTISPECIES: TomO hydrophobic C-terminal domain-containing protein [unclassified Wolbachia]|uniref:TomO hydrophobic C-terminal domain-containing protein n=1 Tax=unclassified Wolbachia TaxID=2640676 RepID=UPI0021F864A7|nr:MULTISPECIES: hypothetical protein [unclassified Wolbachia]
MPATSILKQFGGFTKISVEKFIDWLKSNPKNIKNLSFQSEGEDNGEAFNHYIEDFIKSANLEETQYLNLNLCKISDGVIEALLEKSHTLKEFKHLLLMNHRLSAKGIEALAQLEHSLKDRGQELNVIHVTLNSSYECKAFYDFLKNEYKNQSSNTVNADSIKKMIFDIARSDNNGDWLKYILEQSEKYPFLINSRNEQNETLLSFYTHSPAMQKFLFSHGLIPAKEPERTNESQKIVLNKQSVHSEVAAKKTRFTTKELLKYLEASKDKLEQAATSYMENIPKLYEEYQNNLIKIRLLSITKDEKTRVMEGKLSKNATLPDDKAFVKEIFEKAKKVLEDQYLNKDKYGNYTQEISRIELQYDYTRDDAKITIPQSIGCIKLLIDRSLIPLEEKKELLVSLAEQNPKLVQQKLSSIKSELKNDNISYEQITNRTMFHKLLDNVNDDKVNKLFEEISGFNIEKTWKEQKEFVLLKEIYEAATTYVYKNFESHNACTQGTWGHIINSTDQINLELKKKCDEYLEEQRNLESQKTSITEENITEFVEILASKLIQDDKNNSELGSNLIDNLILNTIDLDRPDKITLAQQKILAEINRKFTEIIKEYLPNYIRNIPTLQEYKIIIKKLLKVKAIEDYAKSQPQMSPQEHATSFFSDEYEQDEQLNLSSSMNSIIGNQPNPTSSDLSISKGDEKLSETITKNQGSFGNIGSKSISYSSEEKALLNMSASNNKQVIQSEVVLSESESEDDKSDITVILANNKKEKHFPTQPAEQADSIDRESKQLKPVTNKQDISTKDNSKSKPKENNVISQNKKMYILVTSALVVAGIVSGIAIAVYSGMLAVGIALGVCCLIAAAVIYYCNSPSNSLENSNTEVAMNQGQEL